MSNLGYNFEIYVVEKFREFFEVAIERNSINKVFRIIGSGRNKLATKSGQDSLLEGDVSVEIDSLPKNILIECKHRKSGAEHSKSFAIKKEWLDQARTEAENNKRWSIVAIRFKGISPTAIELKLHSWYGVDGNAVHYIIPEIHLAEMLKCIESAKSEVLNNSKITLNQISDEDLLNEVKRRFKKESKECSNGGNVEKPDCLQNNIKNIDNL